MSSPFLDRIINNETTSLDISEDADELFDSVHDFLDALKANKSIVSVNLTGDFLSCLRADARSSVLKALGNELDLQTVTLGDTLMMVEGVAHIIAKCPSLRSISLHNSILQGDETSFRALESILYQSSLKEFDMSDNCEAAVEGIDLGRIKVAKKASSTCTAAMPSPTQNSQIAKSA